MSHQYKAGDVVTVFQISAANELVIEDKATIRKRVAEVEEHYRVEFANKPGVTHLWFVDSWGQDDPEKCGFAVGISRNLWILTWIKHADRDPVVRIVSRVIANKARRKSMALT